LLAPPFEVEQATVDMSARSDEQQMTRVFMDPSSYHGLALAERLSAETRRRP
jgi:hypothetical protein